MGFNLADRTTEIYLKTLKNVNDELTSAFDSQLDKLKNEEKQLQEMLRLKTRLDLINSMEKELKFGGDLNDKIETLPDYTTTTKDNNNNLLAATNHSILSTASLDDMIRLSDDSLIKSYKIMDKLSRSVRIDEPQAHECTICEHPVDNNNNSSLVDTNEFLKKTVYSNLGKTKSSPLRFYNNPEPVRPKLIFARKNSSTRKITHEPSRRIKVEMKPSSQDLNKQQTLESDPNFGRVAIATVVQQQTKQKQHRRANSEADLNRILNEQFRRLGVGASSSQGGGGPNNVFDRLYNNSSSSALRLYDYIRLPVHRTLIHDNAWKPGKVNTIYYPYRDFKLNRSHNSYI